MFSHTQRVLHLTAFIAREDKGRSWVEKKKWWYSGLLVSVGGG